MRYVIAALALAGIVVSSLALAAHYGAPAQPTDLLRSQWNSAYVNQSPYAEVHGIPVSLLGISGYLLLFVLSLRRHRVLTAYFAGIGVIYALIPHRHRSALPASLVRVLRVFTHPDRVIAFLAIATLTFNRRPAANQ